MSIDQRVVEMKFNRGDFAAGVKQTLADLDNLRKGLQLKGASAGLEGISKTASRFSLSNMGAGIDAIAVKFNALQVAGVAALGTIVSKATAAGAALVKSFTLDPVMQGFSEYELKLKSTQTILANTARHGTDLATVNRELEALNEYSDKTIYNFAEMTKNASLFTNSGMKIEDATTVIKGFSNAAAASGTSAEGAAGAAYQLSQALSAGTIRLMDWRSLTNVGMGGKNMQEGVITLAKAMGTFEGTGIGANEAAKNFNQSLEKGWLSADVMSNYLQIMSGDMTAAEMAALGLDAAQVKVLQSQAKMGLEAATKVRTFSALMNTLKESVASGWAQSFELVVGNFEEATKLFTAVNNVVGGMLSRSADARNKMLQDWRNNNGRHFLLVGIKNAFEALLGIMKPVRDAFRELFPATTGKQLADLSERFMKFTEGLKQGGDTIQRIKSTFEGIFAVFKIVTMVIGGAIKAFFGLFSTVGAAGGGILATTATIGEFVRSIERFLSHTGAIDKFFTVLASAFLIFKPVISLVSDLLEALSKLATGDFSGFTSGIKDAFVNLGDSIGQIRDKFNDFTNGISTSLGNVSKFFTDFATNAKNSGNEFISSMASGLASVIGFLSRFMADARGTITELIETFKSAGDSGKNFFAGLGAASLSGVLDMVDLIRSKFEALKQAMDFGGTFSAFNEGASNASAAGGASLSAMGSIMTSVFEGIKGALSAIGRGLGPVLSGLGEFFATMTKKIREYIEGLNMQDAVALLNTGFFIAFYMAARKFFSNMSDVTKSISQTFGQLTDTLSAMQNAIRATTIMQIAIAVGVLVGALFILAKIDGDALKLALVALAVVFAQVAAMLKVLTMIKPESMIGAATGMIAISVALVLLAKATEILGKMDPKVLIQGSLALQLLFMSLAGMAMILNGVKGLFVAATGLLILAAAMTAMAGAIALYAAIPFAVLERGILSMGAALLILGVAMQAFPKGMVLKAAGIAILAGAMIVLTGALTALGLLDLWTLTKGIGAMAISLGILAIAAQAMTGALAGAAAMMVMAAAIAVLAPALAMLGLLPMEVIGKGLLAIAGIMAIFVVSMYALAPVIVVLSLFSAAIMTLGLAVLAAGAGFGLFVGALALLTVVGAAGFAALIAGIMSFLTVLPLMVQQAGHAFRAVIAVIRDSAGAIMDAAGALVVAFVQEIAQRVPEIANAGLQMIIGLLAAIATKIGTITILAVLIAKNFLDALGLQLPSIIASGVNFILSFVEGLAKAIRGEKKRTGEAGSDLAMALIEGVISGIKSFVKLLPPQIEALARAGVIAFKKFLGINSPSTVFAGFGKDIVMGLINGIASLVGNLAGKAKELGLRAISAAKNGIANAASAGSEFVGKIVSGIASVAGNIGSKAKEAISNAITAAKNAASNALSIGSDIVSGIARGISNGLSIVTDAAKNLAKSALNAAKKFLGIASPSKEFEKIGVFVNEGFAKGIRGSSDQVQAAYDTVKDLLTESIKASTADILAAEEKLKKLTLARDEDTRALKRANQALLEAKKTKGTADDDRARESIIRLTQSRDANNKAIRDTTLALKESKSELLGAQSGYTELTEGLIIETNALKALSDEHASFTEKIEEANKTLADAIKTRDDYNKSITDQYDNLPDINTDTTLTQYITDLQKQAVDTNLFAEALQQLRNLGLSDEMYKTLLAKGLDAMPFVQEIIKGGVESVEEINKAGSELGEAAKLLGKNGSTALYQAGVDTAQGLVAGLQSQQGAIAAEIQRIADMMVVTMNNTLQIKSPSRVFMKMGVFSAEGLAKGLKDSTPLVSSAAGEVGKTAVTAMQKSLSMLSNAVDMDMNLHPTITPILDLTAMRKESVKMGAMLATSPISVDAAYSSASSASAGYRHNIEATVVEPVSTPEPMNVTFVQNNSSPKALSEAEIYRNTNNQLSRAKGALTGANQGRGS